MMRTSWPRMTNCCRRCVQWLFTPPKTDQSYGETSATFTAGLASGSCRLWAASPFASA